MCGLALAVEAEDIQVDMVTRGIEIARNLIVVSTLVIFSCRYNNNLILQTIKIILQTDRLKTAACN